MHYSENDKRRLKRSLNKHAAPDTTRPGDKAMLQRTRSYPAGNDPLFDLMSRRTKAIMYLSIVAFFATLIYVQSYYLESLVTRAVADDYKIEKVYITEGKIAIFSPYFYGERIWPRQYQHGSPVAGVEVMIVYPDATGSPQSIKERWAITTIDKHKAGDTVPVAVLEYDKKAGSAYSHISRLKSVVAQYADHELERSLPAHEREKLGRVRESVGKYGVLVAEAYAFNRKGRSGPHFDSFNSYREEWEAANPGRIPKNVLIARGEFAPGGKYGYKPAK